MVKQNSYKEIDYAKRMFLISSIDLEIVKLVLLTMAVVVIFIPYAFVSFGVAFDDNARTSYGTIINKETYLLKAFLIWFSISFILNYFRLKVKNKIQLLQEELRSI